MAAVSTTAITGQLLTGCGSDKNVGGITGTAISGKSAGQVDCGGKDDLTAEGSTAQLNAINLFNRAWGQLCPGKNLSYNPTGSGQGREQFIAGNVDIGGADVPLAPGQVERAAERCQGNPAWNLPAVFGPIALPYHLDGVNSLVVNADVLAKIFSGAITTWNDRAITALNPGAALPDTKITPIYRSDASGTTDNFQRYLTVAAPDSWTKGAGTEFLGGAGEGANKSGGIAQAVQATPGAIAYDEMSYVDQAHLSSAQIDNGSGAVPLDDDTAAKAIDAAEFAGPGNDLVLDLNSLYSSKEPGAYPLVLATYEIVCSKGYDPATAAAVKSFLTVALNQGQTGLSQAGYIPLPDAFKRRLLSAINAIQ